ncbi:baseplate protein [Streptomyces sp. NRRL F-5755]|uniref:GPW/gp25 family protein n=1 Tax=Streptomyces sp. NRRL F-5755 TaxID=1519475 RepID=UPI0006AEA71A|nr:GPW/gp25 family protein [Streptomyces sp. NRRL F-5755]KOU08791.1 baseplate protein [Streptomyces sp. NRRL F-5755]
MRAEFVGAGWGFPVNVESDGTVTRAADDQCIKDAVWLILSTAKGERVMHPDFGCGIHDMVLGATASTALGQAAAAVRDALVRWEPRIEVVDVHAETDPATPALLLIHVRYRVRSTNMAFNLVYPFYSEKGVA